MPIRGKETFVTKERTIPLWRCFCRFLKPEWDVALGRARTRIISHTKNQQVRVSIKIDFTVIDGENHAHHGRDRDGIGRLSEL